MQLPLFISGDSHLSLGAIVGTGGAAVVGIFIEHFTSPASPVNQILPF